MKYFKSILIIALFFSSNVFAQDSVRTKVFHSFYFEGLGAVFAPYSFNYELRFRKIIFRVGAGKFKWQDNLNSQKQYSSILWVPCELFILSNYNKAEVWEFGAFLTPSFGNRFIVEDPGSWYRPTKYFFYNVDYSPGVQFGFRSQSLEGHFIFRLDFTLIYLSRYYDNEHDYRNSFLQPSAGLSMGYTFRTHK